MVTLDTLAKELETHALAKEVRQHFGKQKGIVSYHQMRLQLIRKLSEKYNKERYYRIMKTLGLKAVIRRK
ncbi:hypothetical protein ACFSTH_07115 [Paenibacillus yanchengensis]